MNDEKSNKGDNGGIAICPGTFDPVTMGHLDVINRAAKHFRKLIVAVAADPEKELLFSLDERVDLLRECLKESDNIEVHPFNNLLVEFAREYGSCAIVKGLRAMSDFEYEFQMAQLNRKMDARVETFFVMASPEYTFLSSSGIKEVIRYGGCIEGLVPKAAEIELRKKYSVPIDIEE